VSTPEVSLPRGPSRLFVRILANPLTAGVVLGLAALQAWWNLGPAWTAYLVIAVMGLAMVPVIATALAGGVERFLVSAFIFSLQFSVSFNLMYGGKPVPGGQPGFNVSLTILLGLAYLGYFFLNRASAGPWRANRAFTHALMGFVVATLLSFTTTEDKTNSLYGLAGNISLVLIAMVSCHICARRDYLQRAWTLVLSLLVVQCMFYTAQRITNTSFTLEGEILENRGNSGRFGGTMGMAPASLATLEMVALFFTQARLFSKQWKPSWPVAGLFGYGLLCLLLSLTRSCWIGFGVGSIIMSIVAIRRRAMRPSMLGGMAVFAMLALAIAWGPVHDRLGANHQGAADERFLLNYINLEMVKAQPIVGVGINQCYLSRWKYLPSFYGDGDWVYMAHNQYLLVAAETGLVGLATFIWMIVVSFRSAWRAAHSDDLLVKEVGIALVVSIGSLIWGMSLDFYTGMQAYPLLFFIMGFSAGAGVLADQEAEARAATPT